MKKYIITSVYAVLLSFSAYAQDDSISGNPIEEQFSDLIDASNTFKGYKVVDFENLTSLQRNTSSYIEDLKAEILTANEAIKTHNEEIAAIEAQLQNVNAELEKTEAEKDAIVFLGMPFSKGTYKTIMWSIVGILVLALSFFVYRFKKGRSTTLEAKRRLIETEKEFEAFRSKALEKEQRLGRLLQDERNKHSSKTL